MIKRQAKSKETMALEEDLEKVKRQVAESKKRDRAKQLEEEKQHRQMIGKIVADKLPDCYLFEEGELEQIMTAALRGEECKIVIEKIKSADTTDAENNQNGDVNQAEEPQGCGTMDESDQAKIAAVEWRPQQK